MRGFVICLRVQIGRERERESACGARLCCYSAWDPVMILYFEMEVVSTK